MKCQERGAFALVFAAMLTIGGCDNAQGDRASEAPPPAQVEHEQDANVSRWIIPSSFRSALRSRTMPGRSWS